MESLMDISLQSDNLRYKKRYKEAIELLDRYFDSVKDRETLAQFHIGYATNYEKLKDVKKCNYHCEEAIELEHFGTYAYERLIKNYIKDKDFQNALRICETVLKRKNIFSKQTGEAVNLYATKRKEFILKKMG